MTRHTCDDEPVFWISVERNPLSVRPSEIVVERCWVCRKVLRVTGVAEETAPVEDDGA